LPNIPVQAPRFKKTWAQASDRKPRLSTRLLLRLLLQPAEEWFIAAATAATTAAIGR
jgi:hypothetical protein